MIIVKIIYDTRFGGGFSSVFIGFGVYGVTLVGEGYSASPFLFAILIATVLSIALSSALTVVMLTFCSAATFLRISHAQ